MIQERIRRKLFQSDDSSIHQELSSPVIKQMVSSELGLQGIPCHSWLRVSVQGRSGQTIDMDLNELEQVVGQFGELLSCEMQGQSAILQFKELASAYFAQKILNGRALDQNGLRLSAIWHKPQILEYEVKVQDLSFPVARRIIGPRGANMKNIVEACCQGTVGNVHDIIKLRLRGRGSGYKEGPNQVESDEPLHICVSSKYEDKYTLASRMVENLLSQVYKEYTQHCRSKGRRAPSLEIAKWESTSGKDISALLRSAEATSCLSEVQIRELVDVRNEARKQSNFAQADCIRELLKQKGIVLIDGKGARGNSADVTLWRNIQCN